MHRRNYMSIQYLAPLGRGWLENFICYKKFESLYTHSLIEKKYNSHSDFVEQALL
jgi:hypothetical protein